MLAGEDAVKLAGEKYLPRLDSQSDEEEEFLAYRKGFVLQRHGTKCRGFTITDPSWAEVTRRKISDVESD
jgi:hypothetical protein